MPQFLQQPEGTVTIRIFAGKEWRGVMHVQAREYHLSPNYAAHVVGLGVAEYVDVDAQEKSNHSGLAAEHDTQ